MTLNMGGVSGCEAKGHHGGGTKPDGCVPKYKVAESNSQGALKRKCPIEEDAPKKRLLLTHHKTIQQRAARQTDRHWRVMSLAWRVDKLPGRIFSSILSSAMAYDDSPISRSMR